MFLTKIKRSQFYQLVYEIQGKRKTVSTKTASFKEAQNFLSAFTPPTKEKQSQLSPAFTLSQFKDEYIKYAKLRFSKSYVERSIEPAFKFLIEFAGDIPLKQLDLKTLDNFIINKYNSTKSGAALYYRTLKAAFSKAVIWNYLSDNPLKKIKAPKVPKSNPIFINEDELNLILEKTTNQKLNNIFTVAFYTGMRLAEILNMKSSWIDTQQNIITLKNSVDFTTKSKKERIIPIHPRIASIVIKLNSKPDAFIFNRKSDIKFNEDYVSSQPLKTQISFWK
jgi:integrase